MVREAAEAEDAMTVGRVVFWGDPPQHDAVERGTPSADLLEDQSLARADLEKTAPSPQEPLGQWECRFLPSGLGVQCDRYVCPLPRVRRLLSTSVKSSGSRRRSRRPALAPLRKKPEQPRSGGLKPG